jgi:hypothetical protein
LAEREVKRGDKKALDSDQLNDYRGSSVFFTISQLLKLSKLKILVMQALHEKRVTSKTCTATNSLSNIAILNRTSKPNPRLRRSPVAPASGTVGSVMVSPDTKHESPQILERATIVGFLYDFPNLPSGDHETHNEKHYTHNQPLVAFYGRGDLALARNQLTKRLKLSLRAD